MFKRGDKVVCIESTPSNSAIEGKTYTVRAVRRKTKGLLLNETHPIGKVAFKAKRFVKKEDWDKATELVEGLLIKELQETW